MAKLNFLAAADNAFVDKDNKLNAIGIFDTIGAKSFPMTHPKFFVVANITVDEEGPHRMKLSLKKDGNEIKSVDRNDVDQRRFNWIVAFINQKFIEGGIYQIAIDFDGEFLGSREIKVEQDL